MTRQRQKDCDLLDRARVVIPNGVYGHQAVHALPPGYPQFFDRGEGARLWDVDGNKYIDYLCGYGTNLFGYRYPSIEAAADRQRLRGDVMTGPTSLLVDLAETMVGMVSHADWAMFCKNGSDATNIALMTARAHTRKATVLIAEGAYHGALPWSTPRTAGVVSSDRANVVFYRYNDAQSLREAVAKHQNDLAAVFATPYRHDVYADQEDVDLEYARTARELCDQTGALLVVDDVRAGFRIARDCSWSSVGVQPDISAWGKCFANGHPISAVLGSEKARLAAGEIYVTGSYWMSAAPMAAALETLRLIRETDYLERMKSCGDVLRRGLDERATAHGFVLSQTGPAQMPQILFHEDADFQLGFNWGRLCIEEGIYFHPFHNMFLSDAHHEGIIDETLKRVEKPFKDLQQTRHRLPLIETPALVARRARAAQSAVTV